MPFLKGLY